jgi:serine phosphatase RsbU (regulator of sigma subunit)
LEINRQIGKLDKLANSLNNLAAIYSVVDSLDQAIECFNESSKIYEQIGHKSGMALIAQNTANIYFKGKKGDKGLLKMKEAINLYTELNEPKGISICYRGLGKYYSEIKNYSTAIDNYLKAEELMSPLGIKQDLRSLYEQIAQAYSNSNNHQKANSYLKKYIEINDSIFNSEKSNQITEMQEKYDSNKKQQEIELQNTLIAKQNAEVEQQTTQKFAFGIGFVLALGLLFIAYRGYSQKQKANKIILLQKSIVEEKNREITDSITYARRLQEAILPPDHLIKEVLPNSFVVFKPKDVVSGDFYWLEVVNDIIIFAVADCTGHGVPGAMVSVVCSNALNRAVKEFGITEPRKILDKTRELVIATFEKSTENVRDGMDIALCSLNLNSNELQFSGANNPLWILRKDSNEIEEIKGNKQPIGVYVDAEPFTNHKVNLNSGDYIFLFSDGFADQFGGEKGKKMKYKPFKDHLIHSTNNNMEKQKEELISSFDKWKGEMEQVDDVCIIGIRV